jgi:CheY-like chemotaxis protein
MRAALGERTPPAILVTAFNEEDLRPQARAAGFAQVLVKPITPSDLMDAMAQLLGKAPHGWSRAAPDAGLGAEETLRRHHGGQRILLAEDNPINQEVARELLQAVNLQVEVAADGRQAVQSVLAHPPALVLMDMQMPEMDGLTATREIRARLGQALPIIAMTANAFDDDRAACLAAGMNDHIGKPVNPALLYAKLLQWLPPVAAADPVPSGGPRAVTTPPARALSQRLAGVPGLSADAALQNLGATKPAWNACCRSSCAPTATRPRASPRTRRTTHLRAGGPRPTRCAGMRHHRRGRTGRDIRAFEQALASEPPPACTPGPAPPVRCSAGSRPWCRPCSLWWRLTAPGPERPTGKACILRMRPPPPLPTVAPQTVEVLHRRRVPCPHPLPAVSAPAARCARWP